MRFISALRINQPKPDSLDSGTTKEGERKTTGTHCIGESAKIIVRLRSFRYGLGEARERESVGLKIHVQYNYFRLLWKKNK